MSEIRIRRSDSIDLITSPVSFTYRMASPHLFSVRRVLSFPDLSTTTAQTKGYLRSSSELYGSTGAINSRQDYSLYRRNTYQTPRYDRISPSLDYYSNRNRNITTTRDRSPYFRDYGYRRHWSDYGRPPYVPYFFRPTASSSYQWWYYPSAYYYPRVTRTDYLDHRSSSDYGRRYRESYYIPSQFEYKPRYRRWAY